MSKDKETGGSAFPTATLAQKTEGGMTLRDYFAAKAMQAFVTDENVLMSSTTAKEWLEKIAKASYELADEMLKAREIGS